MNWWQDIDNWSLLLHGLFEAGAGTFVFLNPHVTYPSVSTTASVSYVNDEATLLRHFCLNIILQGDSPGAC